MKGERVSIAAVSRQLWLSTEASVAAAIEDADHGGGKEWIRYSMPAGSSRLRIERDGAADVLAIDGERLRDLPLSMRKANLERLLRGRVAEVWRTTILADLRGTRS
jgi:hypothetical protein